MHNLNRVKISPKIVGYSCNFQKTAQCKQSPIGRKFAKSGHPVNDLILLKNDCQRFRQIVQLALKSRVALLQPEKQ
jgi:hypothetical protein